MKYALRLRFCSRPGLGPDMLTVSPLAGRAGLRLDGEADLTSYDELQRALAALPPDAAEIHFELTRLKFIDVAATRVLIARTQQPPPPPPDPALPAPIPPTPDRPPLARQQRTVPLLPDSRPG